MPSTDFIARLADAWDFNGSHIFTPGRREHRALCALGTLPIERAQLSWSELSGEDRCKLVFAARLAIEFGRQAAWVFGEGTGARC